MARIAATGSFYAMQRRRTLAARELLYGQASIDTIAQEHGFANRFHFTRAFIREIGITPAAYRKIQDVSLGESLQWWPWPMALTCQGQSHD